MRPKPRYAPFAEQTRVHIEALGMDMVVLAKL
jgi:hypothetical protein